ncbi:MAG: hypothetical protein A3C07_02090 [Candidatus Sungbacteria bacterium RIFCSPHIGHO2_02_FULL_47_11]|uniref:Sodium/calcium exchanger membrane region domain-containing protein n=1 Tax=Candidatus Sungbacteria bacterium RIFCSPHIGHO2_02_FULL_47_11 TaxID=1802270 RepID=A0A1G2KQC7_9BACT|nr:MAG: hypothetical protein A3C07_02090 [Candidatus Sungbacteria bacterium RIFCSPHIGHO2_02_FULL_47_11]
MPQLLLYSLLFVGSLLVVVQGSRLVIRHATPIARSLRLSDFATSFLVVGVLSAFPETTISVISAFENVPTLGLGLIFGSNVADLTLVFGIAALFTTRGITVRSDFLKKDFIFIIPLLIPILLGFDGFFSRFDGVILILGGVVFFMVLYTMGHRPSFGPDAAPDHHTFKHIFLFMIGIIALLGAAYGTVVFAERIAILLRIPEVLIGLSLITLGTTIPELSFSINAAKTQHGELVLGDILGVVITDATIVLGLMAILNPYAFDRRLIFVTGFAMVLAAIISLNFMRSGRTLGKREGVSLILLYIFFLSVEFSLQGGAINFTP